VRRLPLLVLAALLVLPASASALTVSKAELKGGQLRIEGTGTLAGVFVVAESTTSTTGARGQVGGGFKIQASNFTAPDCIVNVRDGSTPSATVRPTGCTPSVTPPPTTPPPPSGTCVIDPQSAPASFHVGDLSTLFFTTTGCQGGPLQWSLVAGGTPPGMGSPIFQGQTAGAISGTPTVEGTYSFTVKALDAAGQSDTETFTVTITAPRPLTITNPNPFQGVAVGQSYDILLRADGGLPGYTWALKSGTLPPGLAVSSLGHLAGHPTTRGTYSFTCASPTPAGRPATGATSSRSADRPVRRLSSRGPQATRRSSSSEQGWVIGISDAPWMHEGADRGRSVLITIVNACLRYGRGGSPTAVLEEALLTELERRRVPELMGVSHAAFVGSDDRGTARGADVRPVDRGAGGHRQRQQHGLSGGQARAAAGDPHRHRHGRLPR